MATITEGQYASLPGGTRLHYASAGERGRPLLLFLHGFPEFWYAWHAQLARFGDSCFAVAPDLRGFNLSDQPSAPEAYRAKLLVRDMVELIDHLGASRCIIVGHDWGGAIAWQFAISHPERLERLLIINATHPLPFAEGLAQDPEQQAASQYMNWLRAEGSEQALVTLFEFAEFPCPFCSRVGPTLQQILDTPEFAGKVRIVFKHLPLVVVDRSDGVDRFSTRLQTSLLAQSPFMIKTLSRLELLL
jgi:pimeloyl-ACP methyl ester carboxylesterase